MFKLSIVRDVVVAGNLIGTDATGTAAIPNAFCGVLISDSSTSNLIGTTGQDGADDSLERNVISGNDGPGVVLGTIYLGGVPWPGHGQCCGRQLHRHERSRYGRPRKHDRDRGHLQRQYAGTEIPATASNNTIGVNSVYGPRNADQANLISGNNGDGVELTGTGTTGNVVAGNYIGTTVTGDAASAMVAPTYTSATTTPTAAC